MHQIFNNQTKKVCWEIAEKYEKVYPDLADVLCECIQDRTTEEHLNIITMYEYSEALDLEDRNKLRKDMDRYHDYVIQQAAEQEYYNSPEYQQEERERWENDRF